MPRTGDDAWVTEADIALLFGVPHTRFRRVVLPVMRGEHIRETKKGNRSFYTYHAPSVVQALIKIATEDDVPADSPLRGDIDQLKRDKIHEEVVRLRRLNAQETGELVPRDSFRPIFAAIRDAFYRLMDQAQRRDESFRELVEAAYQDIERRVEGAAGDDSAAA